MNKVQKLRLLMENFRNRIYGQSKYKMKSELLKDIRTMLSDLKQDKQYTMSNPELVGLVVSLASELKKLPEQIVEWNRVDGNALRGIYTIIANISKSVFSDETEEQPTSYDYATINNRQYELDDTVTEVIGTIISTILSGNVYQK